MTDDLIVMVLDKSGSMGNAARETINGFNLLCMEQKELADKAGMDTWLTLTLFDQAVDVRYEAANLKTVPKMARTGPNHYQPSGYTALYDGVGMTITATEKWLKANPKFVGRVFFTIFTDGFENSSKTWTLEKLNAAIKAKTDDGWEFAFLGSGEAAWTEGAMLSNSVGAQTTYAGAAGPMGTASTYAGVTRSVTHSRYSGQSLGQTMSVDMPGSAAATMVAPKPPYQDEKQPVTDTVAAPPRPAPAPVKKTPAPTKKAPPKPREPKK